MPSSAVYAFTDPDEYAASIRATKAELTITRRGRFNAKLIRIDLYHLWMQRFAEDLPRVAHSANIAGRVIISFRTQPGPALLVDGARMRPDDVIRHSDAQEYFRRSDGSASYGSMSLPVETIASLEEAMVGCALTPSRSALTISPSPPAVAKLRHLHAAAGRLAEYAPEVIAHPEAAWGLEQALIDAMFGCLGIGEGHEDRSAMRQHAAIMRKFHRVTEENPDKALYIPEVCAAIGASERTLRVCCEEHLGISPKRYLLLRRMHLVRRALRAAAASATTVTEIATRYGFWQFGRFAGEYKSLFGELPSMTLARPIVG
jgi:AraC-like DNA-binding protein